MTRITVEDQDARAFAVRCARGNAPQMEPVFRALRAAMNARRLARLVVTAIEAAAVSIVVAIIALGWLQP